MFCSKIVVAYDGSPSSVEALNKAMEIAKTNPSIEIEIVHVVNYAGILGASLSEETFLEFKRTILKQGEVILNEAKSRIEGIPNKWGATMLEGPPAHRILAHTEEVKADLIVMGSRGLSGLKELFLGSVSHNVTQHSPISVLIVK